MDHGLSRRDGAGRRCRPAQHAARPGRPRPDPRRSGSRGNRRGSVISISGARALPGPPPRVGRRGGSRAFRAVPGRLRGAARGGRRPLLHVGHHRRAARRDDSQWRPGAERRDVRPPLPPGPDSATAVAPAAPQHRLQIDGLPTCCSPTAGSTCRAGSSARGRARAREGRYIAPHRRADDLQPHAHCSRLRPRPRARRPGSPTGARRCRARSPRASPGSFPAPAS